MQQKHQFNFPFNRYYVASSQQVTCQGKSYISRNEYIYEVCGTKIIRLKHRFEKAAKLHLGTLFLHSNELFYNCVDGVYDVGIMKIENRLMHSHQKLEDYSGESQYFSFGPSTFYWQRNKQRLYSIENFKMQLISSAASSNEGGAIIIGSGNNLIVKQSTMK